MADYNNNEELTPSRPETNGEEEKSPDRDSRGRFAPGNRLGLGAGQYATKVAHFRNLLYKTVTDDDVIELIKAMFKEAQNGDVQAGRLLLAYLVGKPPESDVETQQPITVIFHRPERNPNAKSDSLEYAGETLG